jgi:hypothetical protein
MEAKFGPATRVGGLDDTDNPDPGAAVDWLLERAAARRK